MCLDALALHAPMIFPIVVDNASSDDTLLIVRNRSNLRLIANPENRGFAAAVNQAVREIRADIYLLLNPDVRLKMPVEELVEAAKQCGMSAGRLDGVDGRPQDGFAIRRFPTAATLAFELLGINRLWPGNPVNRRYRYLGETPQLVDQPAGAFLLFDRRVWDAVGGFDERFHPVWFEDVDFSRRAADAGFQARYLPEVGAEHTGGHSVGQVNPGCRAMYWYASLLSYAAKHFRPLGFRVVCFAAAVGAVPRSVVGMVRTGSVGPVVTCCKLIHLAGQRWWSGQGR